MGTVPREPARERWIYKLLKKACIDGHCNEDYEITKKELEWLGKRISRLQKLTETICRRKIKSLT